MLLTLLLAATAAAQNPVRDTARPAPGAAPGAMPGMPSRPAPQLQNGPPIRRITTATAVSREPIGAVSSVRELPDGRVILNDGTSRRLLILDTMMAVQSVILDSLAEKENTYGVRQGTLIPHRGDSTLFIDPASLALLVIDPDGRVVRIRSVPRAQEAFQFSGGFGQTQVTTDSKGRLIYSTYVQPERPKVAPPPGVPWIPNPPDSQIIVALDLETRKLDTIGAVRTPKTEYVIKQMANGGISVMSRTNPTPTVDDWAVMPDGSVSFVRGIDYRIDRRSADGQWTSSPKIPYDWVPFPDSMKKAFVDSIENTERRRAREAYVSSMIRWVNTYKRKYPPNFSAPDGYRPPNGFGRDWEMPGNLKFPEKYIYACKPGEEPQMLDSLGKPMPGRATEMDRQSALIQTMMAERGISLPMGMQLPQGGPGTPSCIPQPIPNLNSIPNAPVPRDVYIVDAGDLADYKPPFAQQAVRADLDGNLWIRINTPRTIPGGPIYDVVNPGGEIIDRIQIPPTYTLVGFGRGKVVYVAMRDGSGAHLARVRMK